MRRKLLIFGTFILVIVATYVMFRPHLNVDVLLAHETQLRTMIRERPIVSMMIGVLAYTLMSLIPGTTGKSLIFGWLFNFWSAVFQVNVGLTVAAMITFFVSRHVFRDVIQSRFGLYLDWLNKTMQQDGAYLLITLRLAHFPFTIVNYMMGATPIRPRTFWWASQLGMLPGCMLFVYAGSKLPTLREFATHGMRSLITPQVILAFLLLACVPYTVRWIIKRFWPQRFQQRPS